MNLDILSKMAKQVITIPEDEYQRDIKKWRYWDKTHDVTRWEHDFENHLYTITYNE